MGFMTDDESQLLASLLIIAAIIFQDRQKLARRSKERIQRKV